MKIKTQDLIGPALRYAVAMAGDWNGARTHVNVPVMIEVLGYRPDLLWAHGGPIIERERIDISWQRDLNGYWLAETPPDFNDQSERGATPLIAAMRCYVASKLGDQVDVPEELKCK